MVKIYGTLMCPECVACKNAFDELDLEYDFRDISKSMEALYKFLKLRDTEVEFDSQKESWKPGLPLLVLDHYVTEDKRFRSHKVLLDWEKYLRSRGYVITRRYNMPDDVSADIVEGTSCPGDGLTLKRGMSSKRIIEILGKDANKSVRDLGFSSRVVNCLMKYEIETLYGIIAALFDSRMNIERLRNLGEKSISEIYEKLRSYNVEIPQKERRDTAYGYRRVVG